jgi:acyl-CoA thioesterase-2
MNAAEFLKLMDLERAGPDRWLGHTPDTGWKRVFGGQVVAQALSAAQRTVADRAAHSLHAYFLLGGDPSLAIEYDVERIRDGRSFATRRVTARQRYEAIFIMSASFHVDEEGVDHFIPAPTAAPPEEVPDPLETAALAGEAERERTASFFKRIAPIEFRALDDPRRLSDGAAGVDAVLHWLRIGVELPDDPAIHRVAVAYLSDLTLFDAALAPHGHSRSGGEFQLASLDHALWFHRPARADQWLLYVQDSPSAQDARGLNRGLFYDRSGRLVASVAQEGLMRRRRVVDPDVIAADLPRN